MKKFLSIILLTAAISLPSQAQIKFGAKAGVNLTNMSFSESVGDKSNRAGFFVGPTVLINLPIVGLGIDASALYDQREAKGQGQTIKAQQIAIPINVRYGVGLGTMASIFAYAGPQFGFNVGSKEKNLATGVDWKLASSNFSINMGPMFRDGYPLEKIADMMMDPCYIDSDLTAFNYSRLTWRPEGNEPLPPESDDEDW